MEKLDRRTYAADFTALGNKEDLTCSNDVEVAFEKPSADSGTLTLECDCGLSHTGSTLSFSLGVGTTIDTRTFTLKHPPGGHVKGVCVTTKLTCGSGNAANDRIAINVDCPTPIPGNGQTVKKKRKKGLHAAPNPIELVPHDVPIELYVGEDKRLKGTYLAKVNPTIIVAVVELLGSGREAILFVKVAREKPLLKKWTVKLPKKVWALRPRVAIRFFLTTPKGGIYQRSYSARVI